MQSWLEGINWVGKGAKATGRTARLRILSSKADSNTWESSRGVNWSWSHHAQTSSGKGLPSCQKHCQKHLTWAKVKNNWIVAQWSKVPFLDESKFSISFGNQDPRVWRKSAEAQNPCYLKSSVKFYWCWSTVFSEVHSQHSHLPGHFRALHACFCLQALWRCWFHFPAGLGTCPHCQRYQKGSMTMVLLCLTGQQTRLTWTPLRIYGVLSRGSWATPDPTMQMTWRPLSKQPGLPLHLSSATGLLPPCHAALMQ